MGGLASEAEEALLTVGILRQMLAGGGDPFESVRAPMPMAPAGMAGRRGGEAAPYSTQGAPISGHYAPMNVSAAEAMEDIAQLERLVGRLAGSSQPGYVPSGHSAPRSLYGVSYGAAEEASPAQAAEVVARMVENIAQDSRLLPPVQQVVRALEPALMQLAAADPRFFSDREHPARRLLQEITDRSLGFDNVQAPGFESFLLALHDNALPLAQATIHSRDDFEPVLELLQQRWAESEAQREQERKRAIESLWRAEQRHLLASRLAKQIRHLPEFDLVPAEIGAFLQGPWSQVLAQARLSNDNGQADPGRYREFVDALLWSAQPEETRKNPARLARLVPKLLARLREGLASIGYPPTELGAFMDCLMRLHQMAFQGTAHPARVRPRPRLRPPPPQHPRAAPRAWKRLPKTNPGSPRQRPRSRASWNPLAPAARNWRHRTPRPPPATCPTWPWAPGWICVWTTSGNAPSSPGWARTARCSCSPAQAGAPSP